MTEARRAPCLTFADYPKAILLGEKAREETPKEIKEVKDESPEADLMKSQVIQARSISQPTSEELESKKVVLGKKSHKLTLVLDIDETLVSPDRTSEATPSPTAKKLHPALCVRPYARWLLKEMSKLYEVVLFTAGEESYAQYAANILDTEGTSVKKVLGRESCVRTAEGYLVKDLRIFADRNLNEILIADNSILSFAFQLENGIPVSDYTSSSGDDTELLSLGQYLRSLAKESDPVSKNAKLIGLC